MVDLFDNYELLPPAIIKILDKYPEVDTYSQCEALKKELETHKYTISYYLDATPYNLRRKLPNIKNLQTWTK